MSETEAQTTKKRTKKDDYIVQGSILAAAAVLTKIHRRSLQDSADEYLGR